MALCRRNSTTPLQKIHESTFSIVMIVVALVLLVIRMTVPVVTCRGITIDLPRVNQAALKRGAARSDAIIIGIFRDGKIWLGSDQISPAQVAIKIEEQLRKGSPRRIYVQADARARYKSVADVLDGVRSTGMADVSFLVETRIPRT